MILFSYIYSVCLYFCATIVFFGLGFFLLLFGFISRRLLFWFVPFFCRCLLFSLGVRLKVVGAFPDKGKYVIMCNHTSFIDVFTFPCFINGYFTAISAKKNFKIPVFGTMLRLIKAIPIDRSNHEKAVKSISFAETFLINSNFNVVILPEGTRTLCGNLGAFKKGGFHMAKNTNLPILPMVSIGSFDYKPKNRFTLRPQVVTIKIGQAIGSSGETVESLMNKTYNKMLLLIDKGEN